MHGNQRIRPGGRVPQKNVRRVVVVPTDQPAVQRRKRHATAIGAQRRNRPQLILRTDAVCIRVQQHGRGGLQVAAIDMQAVGNGVAHQVGGVAEKRHIAPILAQGRGVRRAVRRPETVRRPRSPAHWCRSADPTAEHWSNSCSRPARVAQRRRTSRPASFPDHKHRRSLPRADSHWCSILCSSHSPSRTERKSPPARLSLRERPSRSSSRS